eukprot:CAMPEP_0181487086 /NCGR_PEP_ID=MMETSP1110-20121109/47610_1 /TAXON_ID=174948 /ORGANISM="Symbiodinium sp., Strain CCMP421" /LENGTH=34 /DNA_ID= /DNA_START= /DNA_END= /DNA_ORIENTATION=
MAMQNPWNNRNLGNLQKLFAPEADAMQRPSMLGL